MSKKSQSQFRHPSRRVAAKMATRQAVIDTYVGALMVAVFELAKRLGCQDTVADEVSVLVAEKFLLNAEENLVRYPTPQRYANVATRHARISFERSERAQRAEGAALVPVVDSDGNVHHRVGRPMESGDVVVGDSDTTRFDLHVGSQESMDDRVIEALEAADMVDLCFEGVDPRSAEWVIKVDGYGYTVVEVALEAKLERETVQRHIGVARKQFKANYERITRSRESVSAS
jgi:DNA-directed RNA polymerase specialized sigma24 family protein